MTTLRMPPAKGMLHLWSVASGRMISTALFLLLGITEAGSPELSIGAAVRLAACGPSEADHVRIETLLRGATYDHLGGGFHDMPGGPKRLETNAWYLNALSAAYEAKPDLFVRNMALDIVAFVLRDLKDGVGAFFRSLGNEGTSAYFSFSEAEIRAALGPDKSREFFLNFALSAGGFPRLTGSPFAGLADTRQTLLLRRLRRVRLPLDDTLDPDANGLWVAALSRTATALGRHDLMEAARRAAGAISRSKDGGAAGAAFGFAALEHFDPGQMPADVVSRALDRAIETSQAASAVDLSTIAMALAHTLRAHPSETRKRQLSRLMREIERRFPDTEALTAARCAAATAVAKAP